MQFEERLVQRTVLPVTIGLLRSAAAISQRYQISCWDAAIIAAAQAMECDAAYSEDLKPGSGLRRRSGSQPVLICLNLVR